MMLYLYGAVGIAFAVLALFAGGERMRANHLAAEVTTQTATIALKDEQLHGYLTSNQALQESVNGANLALKQLQIDNLAQIAASNARRASADQQHAASEVRLRALLDAAPPIGDRCKAACAQLRLPLPF